MIMMTLTLALLTLTPTGVN